MARSSRWSVICLACPSRYGLQARAAVGHGAGSPVQRSGGGSSTTPLRPASTIPRGVKTATRPNCGWSSPRARQQSSPSQPNDPLRWSRPLGSKPNQVVTSDRHVAESIHRRGGNLGRSPLDRDFQADDCRPARTDPGGRCHRATVGVLGCLRPGAPPPRGLPLSSAGVQDVFAGGTASAMEPWIRSGLKTDRRSGWRCTRGGQVLVPMEECAA